MSSDDHDQAFVRTFLAVLGALIAFTFVIIVIARVIMSAAQPEEMLPEQRERVERRTAPVFEVVTDAAQAQRVAQADNEADNEADSDGGARETTTPASTAKSGKTVYNSACSACHQAGVAGAPKLDDAAAWKQRLSQGGKDGLYGNAINGLNAMPAKGGNPALSDEEIEKAVDYMLEQAGA